MLFRSALSAWWGYKKNNKSGNGWLTIEINGDILVKNIWRSDYIGRVGHLHDINIKKKSLSLKNDLNDNIILYFKTLNDRSTFEAHIKGKTSKVQQEDNFDKIKKLSELKDLGIISETEFEQKKKELLNEI